MLHAFDCETELFSQIRSSWNSQICGCGLNWCSQVPLCSLLRWCRQGLVVFFFFFFFFSLSVATEEVQKRLMHGNFQPNVGLGFKLCADPAVLVQRVQGGECIG